MDERVNLRDIRANEEFYWCEYGKCVAYRATANPMVTETGYMLSVAQLRPGRKPLFRHLHEVFEKETRMDYPRGYALRLFRQLPVNYEVV